jgi:hypothetical protein
MFNITTTSNVMLFLFLDDQIFKQIVLDSCDM